MNKKILFLLCLNSSVLCTKRRLFKGVFPVIEQTWFLRKHYPKESYERLDITHKKAAFRAAQKLLRKLELFDRPIENDVDRAIDKWLKKSK